MATLSSPGCNSKPGGHSFVQRTCVFENLLLLRLGASADSPAFTRRCLVCFLAAPRAALFAATGFFVHRGPSAAFHFFRSHTSVIVTFLNVLGLAFLFRCVTGFISPWHNPFQRKEAGACRHTPASQRTFSMLPLQKKWMHLLASHPLQNRYFSSSSVTASALISLSAISVSVSSVVFSSSRVSFNSSETSSRPSRSAQVQMVP